MKWRLVDGLTDLLTFAAGKIVASKEHFGDREEVIFTDGTGIRVTSYGDYSEQSGGHSVEWEIGTP